MSTCLGPVGVHEEDRLSRALLAGAGVGILVALPRHVFDIAHVRSEELPVETRILQKHLRRNRACQSEESTWMGVFLHHRFQKGI